MVHIIVFKHFIQSLVSAPFMLASLLVFSTGWRSRELYKELTAAKTIGEKRLVAAEQLLSLLLDAVALVGYAIVTLLLWHKNEMRVELKDKRGLKVHSVIMKFFGLTVIDLPFILMTFVVFALFWRSKVMYYQLKAVSNKNLNKKITPYDRHVQVKTNQEKRGVALMQFSLLFVDVPAAVCAIVVLATGFKAPKMIRRVKEVKNRFHS